MMKKKNGNTLEAAIEKSAFMVFGDKWKDISKFPPESIQKGLYIAVKHSWNEKIDEKLGNGFLAVPESRISEITERENAEVSAIVHLLMDSNITARKSYIRNNPDLSKALKGIYS